MDRLWSRPVDPKITKRNFKKKIFVCCRRKYFPKIGNLACMSCCNNSAVSGVLINGKIPELHRNTKTPCGPCVITLALKPTWKGNVY